MGLIKINMRLNILVNVFTPFDVLLELFGRKGFTPYYVKFNATSPYGKAKAIFCAEVDKTSKLIRIKNENFGLIPYRVEDVCNRNICGKIRLWVAYRH